MPKPPRPSWPTGGRYDGPTPPFTGSQSPDLADLAGIAPEVPGGRTVHRLTLTDEEVRAKMAERGAPGPAADVAPGVYVASRAGEFASLASTLARLLGRPPISMRDVIAEEVGG